MALPSDWKTGGQYFEWCTELPFNDRPRKSPTFTLCGIEYCLEFCRKFVNKTWFYYLRLMHNQMCVEVPCSSFTIYAGYKRDGALYEHSGRQSTEYIWYASANEIQSRVTTLSLEHGNFYRFFIVFHDIESLTTQVNTKLKEAQLPSPLLTATSYSCLKSLSQDLKKLLDGQEGTEPDVKLECGGEVIPAHGLLLTSRSPVFAAMLQSDMVEGRTRQVKIQDASPEVFKEFVQYLYSGTLSELTVDKAIILYEIGDKYSVKSLMQRCGNFLTDNLKPEDACEYLVLADSHQDQALKEKVMAYILEKEIHLKGDLWLPFCRKHPMIAIEVLNHNCKLQSKK